MIAQIQVITFRSLQSSTCSSRKTRKTPIPAKAIPTCHVSFNASVKKALTCWRNPSVMGTDSTNALVACSYACPLEIRFLIAGSRIMEGGWPERVLNTEAGMALPKTRPKLRTNCHVAVALAVSASESFAWTAGSSVLMIRPKPAALMAWKMTHSSVDECW